jgi:hypothetical protein
LDERKYQYQIEKRTFGSACSETKSWSMSDKEFFKYDPNRPEPFPKEPMRKRIENILLGFETLSLAETERFELMERTETKFLLNVSLLPQFLQHVEPDYLVLEVDNFRIQRYESTYYDTAGFSMYFAHHSGKEGRFKIRVRRYVESAISFLEVKFKNNRGQSKKDMIPIAEINPVTGNEQNLFLTQKSGFGMETLAPKLQSDFSRITLVGKSDSERLTIDFEIGFKNGGRAAQLPFLAIIEAKQARLISSPAIKVLRGMNIQTHSISKYCLGVVLLFDQLKRNNFKPILFQINKIKNEIPS